jgi:hypothetical protein
MKPVDRPMNPTVGSKGFKISQQTTTEVTPKTGSLLLVKPKTFLQISQSI